ncbi:MAG: amidohydrolase family protein [Betaproteobacteria bacterium]|nr:amidohydrolase family protein [Betaproteobacteria bacterium]
MRLQWTPHLTFSSVAALVVAFGCTVMGSAPHAQGQGDWIDVHVHLFADKGALADFDEAARTALQIMDAEHIRTMLVMSPPRAREGPDTESLAELTKQHGPRLAMLGGGGTLNPLLQEAGKSPELSEGVRRQFEATAERLIASGAKGFGEITAHHLSLAPGHAYAAVSPDHPLLRLLADIAARHDVPIDLHLDPVPSDIATPAHLGAWQNPAVLQANIEGFERLLAHNRKTKIVWAHAGSDPLGSFTPTLVRELLARHLNLALSIRPTSPRPGAMVHPTGEVNAEWVAVLRDFPDRFVLGSDTMIVATHYTGPQTPRLFASRGEGQRRGIRRLLSVLPPDVARRIGYENAERLYKLGR